MIMATCTGDGIENNCPWNFIAPPLLIALLSAVIALSVGGAGVSWHDGRKRRMDNPIRVYDRGWIFFNILR